MGLCFFGYLFGIGEAGKEIHRRAAGGNAFGRLVGMSVVNPKVVVGWTSQKSRSRA